MPLFRSTSQTLNKFAGVQIAAAEKIFSAMGAATSRPRRKSSRALSDFPKPLADDPTATDPALAKPAKAYDTPAVAAAPSQVPSEEADLDSIVVIPEDATVDDPTAPEDDATAPEAVEEATAPPPEPKFTELAAVMAAEVTAAAVTAVVRAVSPHTVRSAPPPAIAPSPAPVEELNLVADMAPAPATAEVSQTLQVQIRPGDDPCLLFRRVAELQCGMHWAAIPVREPPTLPDGVARKLRYLDDSTAFMDSDLNLLYATLRDHGYEKAKGDTDDWAIWWHSNLLKDGELGRLATMQPHQRINKWPGAGALTHKAALWECVRDARLEHGSEHFDFMPQTFVLPAEIGYYEACMRREEAEGNYWILKPCERSRGTGIFVHKAAAEKMSWGGVKNAGGVMPNQVRNHIGVASRYIDPPMLLDGFKFDLRLYVLVTSVHPLCVYLYDEGLARFATEKYDLTNGGNLDRRCMHLTNYSLNKKAKDFVPNMDEDVDGVGSKWSLSALRARLRTEIGADAAAKLWAQVDDLIVKSVIAAEPTLAHATASALPAAANGEPTRACFQLFGFDVMMDADTKPWLLEVNCDPALGMGSPLDLKIKSTMLCDALNVVGMPVPTAERHSHRASTAAAAEPPLSPLQRWESSSGDTAGVEQWAVHLVDTEYKRSKAGRWKRLLPCKDGRERYVPLIDPSRALNKLPFAMDDDERELCA